MADRHFHRKSDEGRFNTKLADYLKDVRYTIQHVDSQQNLVINLADFVAGAILVKYNKQNSRFSDIIQESIAFEKIVNWTELKRKSFQN